MRGLWRHAYVMLRSSSLLGAYLGQSLYVIVDVVYIEM